jgi:cytochrome c556
MNAVMKTLKYALPILLFLPFAAAAMTAADKISARRNGLKAVGHQMDQIEALLDQRADPRAAADSIAQMIRFFEGMPALFPPGSGEGETRARTTIWSDAGGFATANANMIDSLRALEASANMGDRAALNAAFQHSVATCTACHRPFRSRSR